MRGGAGAAAEWGSGDGHELQPTQRPIGDGFVPAGEGERSPSSRYGFTPTGAGDQSPTAANWILPTCEGDRRSPTSSWV